MVLGYLSSALEKLRPLKAPVLVVAVSALLALLFTIATRPSEPAHPAGEAAMRLINAEHDLAAASIQSIIAVATAEQEADARSRAEMRAVAMAERRATPDMPAGTATAKQGKPVQTAAAVLAKPGPANEPPLLLQPAAIVQPDTRQPVAQRARAVLATVEQIPQWLRAGVENVADWAVTVPARTLSRLPERRFL